MCDFFLSFDESGNTIKPRACKIIRPLSEISDKMAYIKVTPAIEHPEYIKYKATESLVLVHRYSKVIHRWLFFYRFEEKSMFEIRDEDFPVTVNICALSKTIDTGEPRILHIDIGHIHKTFEDAIRVNPNYKYDY